MIIVQCKLTTSNYLQDKMDHLFIKVLVNISNLLIIFEIQKEENLPTSFD